MPDPATIRPLGVLKLTLELLKKKWRQENNYGYICDQFKSMRQDLTVSFFSRVLELVERFADNVDCVSRYNGSRMISHVQFMRSMLG